MCVKGPAAGAVWRGGGLGLALSGDNAVKPRYRDYLSRYLLFVNDAGRDVVFRVTMPF